MVKLSIFYPDVEGSKFDKEYYLNTHMPLSIQLQGELVKGVQVEFVINGLPGAKPTYIAMCHFLYDSFEAFETAFMPHADVLQDDIKNYTNVEPVIQFSEVVLDK